MKNKLIKQEAKQAGDEVWYMKNFRWVVILVTLLCVCTDTFGILRKGLNVEEYWKHILDDEWNDDTKLRAFVNNNISVVHTSNNDSVAVVVSNNISIVQTNDTTSVMKKKKQKIIIPKQPETYQCHIVKDHNMSLYPEEIIRTVTLPKLPDFIIAGTVKGGTTALQRILRQHPNLLPAHGLGGRIHAPDPEPHFFDFRGLSRVGGRGKVKLKRVYERVQRLSKANSSHLCNLRTTYAESYFFIDQLLANNDTTKPKKQFSFEKTPDYMYYPDLPQLVHLACPWTKIILVLRNPIDRYYSQWKMTNRSGAHKPRHPHHHKDFDQAVAYDANVLRSQFLTTAPPVPTTEDDNNNNTTLFSQEQQALFHVQNFTILQENRKRAVDEALKTPLHQGCYASHIMSWMEYFPLEAGKLLVLRYEDFAENPRKVVDQVHEFVGLPPHRYPNSALNADYSPRQATGANKKFSDRKSTSTMKQITRTYLERFYKPYNDELANLLGEHWRGIWD